MTSGSRVDLATQPPEPRSAKSTTTNSPFDIVTHYTHLLSSDPSLTPAIAAIQSLLAALTTTPTTTISETLTLLKSSTSTLLASQRNPIPLSAGTELLQRYVITTFQSQPSALSGADFTHLRRQLLTNSKLFVSRTKSARSKIARYALPFVRDDCTVISYGSSRVVDAILCHAADNNRYFHVIFVSSSLSGPSSNLTDQTSEASQIHQTSTRLLSLGIPVATIPLAALSHTISSLSFPIPVPSSKSATFLLLGAEAVLENGACISNLGSHLVATIAKSQGIPCYFAAESYKFTRQFPTGYGDEDLKRMGTRQGTLRWRVSVEGEEERRGELGVEAFAEGEGVGMVDITPSGEVSGLITENGVMGVEGVAEEAVKLWF